MCGRTGRVAGATDARDMVVLSLAIVYDRDNDVRDMPMVTPPWACHAGALVRRTAAGTRDWPVRACRDNRRDAHMSDPQSPDAYRRRARRRSPPAPVLHLLRASGLPLPISTRHVTGWRQLSRTYLRRIGVWIRASREHMGERQTDLAAAAADDGVVMFSAATLGRLEKLQLLTPEASASASASAGQPFDRELVNLQVLLWLSQHWGVPLSRVIAWIEEGDAPVSDTDWETLRATYQALSDHDRFLVLDFAVRLHQLAAADGVPATVAAVRQRDAVTTRLARELAVQEVLTQAHEQRPTIEDALLAEHPHEDEAPPRRRRAGGARRKSEAERV
jgi:hypothetical protein